MKVLQKFENHLWYLSERLVVLSLFSDKVSNEDKNKMAKKMIKCSQNFKKIENPLREQRMPQITLNTNISDLVGPDSWTIFNGIGVFPEFLRNTSCHWSTDQNYQYIYEQLKHIKVVNDSAERSLGLVTEFHNNRITCDKEQQEFLYRNVKFMREEQEKLAGKRKERFSKRVLRKINYMN